MKIYLKLLYRWSWLIVMITALAGTTAYFVSQREVPVYEATSTLLVNQAPNKNSSNYDSLLTSEGLARTYAQLLSKRPILEAVVTSLKLSIDADRLSKRVSTSVVHDTQLIVLTVEDTDPQRAADIANEIGRVFNEQIRPLQIKHYAESKQSLQQELANLQSEIDRTKARLDSQKIATTIEERANQNQLETLLAQYRSSYATLLESYEEIRLLETQATVNLEVVESAKPEHTPVRPNTMQSILLAAIVGFVLSLGLLFLAEYLDDTIRSSEKVVQLTGYEPLATIPRIEVAELPDKLITSIDLASPVAQIYHALATNLLFSLSAQPIHTILVTSSELREGKSITAANLAVTMARTGRRVILVDMNLRHPTLHQLFRRANLRGATTALPRGDKQDIDDALVPTSVNKLRLMPSGPLVLQPAELLESSDLHKFMEELKAQADVVVVDSPPLLNTAETLLLAHVCDATLLVVRASSTRAATLKRATSYLAQPMLGIVLNGVASARSGSYRSGWRHLRVLALLRKRSRHANVGAVDAVSVSDGTNPARNL